MLFLLSHSNALNVVVMVTRWYGGIHLGPDRFKHITSLTKDILESMRVIGANRESDNAPAAAKVRIRPASDIVQRIRWDDSVDASEYSIIIQSQSRGIYSAPM